LPLPRRSVSPRKGSIVKRIVIGVAIAALAYTAAPATAHNTNWYWSVRETEHYLVKKGYASSASCDGFGKFFRERGLRWFRHFDCYARSDGYEMTVHVTGRRWARVYER
jgi:hypothetical protein